MNIINLDTVSAFGRFLNFLSLRNLRAINTTCDETKFILLTYSSATPAHQEL